MPGRIMLCDASWSCYLELLLGVATWRCYLEDFNLLSSTCCKTKVTRSVVFDKTSYPPLILAFCSSVHRYGPLHIYPCICSVAPCLRVLWMSTHGCFSPPFPLSLLPGCRNQMLEPWSQTPPSTTTTTLEEPTTTCRLLTTTWSSLGGSQAGGLRLFRSVSQFVLAILWQLV